MPLGSMFSGLGGMAGSAAGGLGSLAGGLGSLAGGVSSSLMKPYLDESGGFSLIYYDDFGNRHLDLLGRADSIPDVDDVLLDQV